MISAAHFRSALIVAGAVLSVLASQPAQASAATSGGLVALVTAYFPFGAGPQPFPLDWGLSATEIGDATVGGRAVPYYLYPDSVFELNTQAVATTPISFGRIDISVDPGKFLTLTNTTSVAHQVPVYISGFGRLSAATSNFPGESNAALTRTRVHILGSGSAGTPLIDYKFSNQLLSDDGSDRMLDFTLPERHWDITLNPGDSFSFYNDKMSMTSIAYASLVPEPAAWAMMVGGFGLVGASIRRRRSQSVVV